jgi:hypothetical protein
VKASVEYSGKAKGIDVSFFNLDNISNFTPCSASLTNWVIELARDQVLVFSRKADEYNLFCQLDGGQKGQEVRLFSLLDESDKIESGNGGICQFWADLTYTGKASDEVAAGTNQLLKKFGNPNKQINGSTSDSVATQMSVPKLGYGTNKACPTHAVHTTSNLCFV